MPYQYRIASDLGVEVYDDATDSWYRPRLSDQVRQMVIDDVITPWGSLIRKVAAMRTRIDGGPRDPVPPEWIASMVWRESHGNPTLQGPVTDHGLGLMMITSQGLKQGLSDDAVMDPETNLRLGADFLSTIRQKVGDDFPMAAATYNAGSVRPSSSSPWGYVESPGHITEEVEALNDILSIGLPGGGASLGGMLAFAAFAGISFYAVTQWRLV